MNVIAQMACPSPQAPNIARNENLDLSGHHINRWLRLAPSERGGLDKDTLAAKYKSIADPYNAGVRARSAVQS